MTAKEYLKTKMAWSRAGNKLYEGHIVENALDEFAAIKSAELQKAAFMLDFVGDNGIRQDFPAIWKAAEKHADKLMKALQEVKDIEEGKVIPKDFDEEMEKL